MLLVIYSAPLAGGAFFIHLPPPAVGPSPRNSYNIQHNHQKKPWPVHINDTCARPTLKSAAAPGPRPGTVSLYRWMMKLKVWYGFRSVAAGRRIHARKRPCRPANAEIRPGCGKALPGPLRRHTTTSVSLSAGLAGQGGGGIGEIYQTVTGCAGSRRPLPPEYSLTAAGAFMPLCGIQKTGCALLASPVRL
jgi:hypothetical protein